MINPELPHKDVYSLEQAIYIARFFQEYPKYTDLLLKHGKLKPSSIPEADWSNVLDHCLMQAAAAEIIADWLQLDKTDRKVLIRTVLVHDWEKRIDRVPRDFTYPEYMAAIDYEDEIKVDKEILSSTSAGFVIKQYNSLRKKGQLSIPNDENSPNKTLLTLLVYYLDEITSGSDIVILEDRIRATEKRRQDMNEDENLTEQLNGTKYWDAVRVVGNAIEQVIWNKLKDKGIDIASPRDIPAIIKQQLELNWN